MSNISGQLDFFGQAETEKIYSVAEVNGLIRGLLKSEPVLGGLQVRGELSNYKIYPSGHHYFTLKDAESALRCVMFKGAAMKLRFKPENGMRMLAFGRVDVFPRDGAYQLYVDTLTPDGVGDLFIEFERLKAKLLAEGLFSDEHKKPVPKIPGTIAVITSSAGAAVRDMIRILGARWPLARIVLLPVRVQGDEAPPELVGAIRYANRHRVADVIITGRGGGSAEDLWAFNDERVARAIFESEIPVISAVGHEPDVTIADFVADLRAATPSNAAELAVPDINEVYAAIASYANRLERTMSQRLAAYRQRIDALSGRRIMQSPRAAIDDRRLALDRITERMGAAALRQISVRREGFSAAAAALDALSPLKVLGRGYAIARTEGGSVIRTAKDAPRGEKITVRLQKDELKCIVEE
ncbi:MAG: exodeoxyribonuclease VII large subunit [Oscillospiraceae bacterium]|nr:exodeoxyribonuclease VII large subunit [Oscillospiraceae bacterium]